MSFLGHARIFFKHYIINTTISLTGWAVHRSANKTCPLCGAFLCVRACFHWLSAARGFTTFSLHTLRRFGFLFVGIPTVASPFLCGLQLVEMALLVADGLLCHGLRGQAAGPGCRVASAARVQVGAGHWHRGRARLGFPSVELARAWPPLGGVTLRTRTYIYIYVYLLYRNM